MSIINNPLLKETLDKCSRVFIVIALFGLAINLLMLTAPLFMMQVFDRVITSRNTDTLLLLMLVAGFALLTMSLLEGVRTFVLVRVSSWLDSQIGGAALTASIVSTLNSGKDASIQALRDLGTFRSFLTGPSVFPILDAPFAPIFLGIMFLLHPILGWIALIGAIILLILAVSNEMATRKLLAQSNEQSIIALKQAESASRNADVIEAMGMMPQLIDRWNNHNADALAAQANASDRGGIIAAASKFVRVMLQIGVTGAGAWLVIQGELTAGSMIAGSIIMGRALAPVEQAIGSWKGFLSARAAYNRLREQLNTSAVRQEVMALPRPKGTVSVEGLSYTHVNMTEPILRNINFKIEAGEVLGIIGPTAAGKTTLVRILVGNLKPRIGHARLDQMDVAEWSADDRGKHIGYLPQDIELFSGTIRENIARMGEGDPADVIAAAKMAGIHEMVLRLEKGYETEIGEGGAALSGGQRQRIALARAVYGNPSFLVLDEPNANLDSVGESALMNAMENLRAQGMTIFVIAHRPNILQHVDKILVLKDGMVQEFGYRDDVMMKLQGVQKALPGPANQTVPMRRARASSGQAPEAPAQTIVTPSAPKTVNPRPTAQASHSSETYSAAPASSREKIIPQPKTQANGNYANGKSPGMNGGRSIKENGLQSVHKGNIQVRNGQPQVKQKAAVLTMGPSEKIKTKIQSLTSHPLSDSEISKIYALFVKGDQQGALKYIEDLRR
ncbi:MAG: type I secretion system permease/ATPase [Proteobacteria bacterium]|nr:type I secretion system permease/ATPase [Pseudomonadota bacterium]